MEQVPLQDSEVDLTDHVARACAEFDVEDAHDEVEALSRNCLRSEPVRRAANATRIWRELAVAVHENETTTMGRIDLLFEEDGSLVLVDYKTDRVGTSDLAALRERHAGQMAAYAASLLAATEIPVDETQVVAARVSVAAAPRDDG